ncbi:MAG: hypothetical protein N2235_17535 [Fischerella sp.]|nr:hypothetical protein [Fischerella sp.]
MNISLRSERFAQLQARIYCCLYAFSQELFKLAPALARLLSRCGELG